MKRFFCAAVLIALCGQTSFAEEVVQNEKAYDWSGAYIGVEGGYSSSDQISYNNGVPVVYGSSTTVERTGTSTGVYAGYRLQNKETVYGLEISRTDGTRDKKIVGAATFYKYSVVMTDYLVTIGHAFDDTLLSLGLGRSVWEVTPSIDHLGFGGLSGWGNTASLSLDKMLNDRLSIGISYTMRDFERHNFDTSATWSGDGLDRSLALRLGYQF